MKDNKLLLLMFAVFICGACAIFYNYSQVVTHLTTKNYPQIMSLGQPGDVWMVNDEGNLAPMGIDFTGQRRGTVENWSFGHGILTLGDMPVQLYGFRKGQDWQEGEEITLILRGQKWLEITDYREGN